MKASFEVSNDNSKKSVFSRLFGAKASAWENYVPMTQSQAEEILTRDLPPETKVSLRVDAGGEGRISIKGGAIEESRSFDLQKGVINSGYIEITGAERKGQGLGRRIMRNEIEFFRACGVKKFKIYAALGNGGYTWARLGFLPDSNELKSGGYFQERLEKRFSKLEPLLEEQEKPAILEALKLRDARDAWRLADTRIDLAPRLRAVFDKAAAKDPAAAAKRAELLEIYDTLAEELAGGKPMPFGRLLMAGTSWDGHMEFDNAEQMSRVEAYVGGWHAVSTVVPAPQARKFKFW